MSNTLFAGFGLAALSLVVIAAIVWGLLVAAFLTWMIMHMITYGVTFWPLFGAVLSGGYLIRTARTRTD